MSGLNSFSDDAFPGSLREVAQELASAAEARHHYEAHLKEFQDACSRYDWEAANECRIKVEAASSAYLDAMTALYRHLQSL